MSRPQRKNASLVINPLKAEQAHVALRNRRVRELQSPKIQPTDAIVRDTFIKACSLLCISAF